MQSLSLFIFVLTIFHFNYIKCQLAGGFTDQDPSKYTSHAWKAVPEINEQNNGPYYLIPIKVLTAKTQVVNGLNTLLEVLVGESTCLKGSVPVSQITSANCSPKPGGQKSLYSVLIFDIPYENYEQISAEKIQDVLKAKTQVVSGLNTLLEVLVGESTCLKESVPVSQITSANCSLKPGGQQSIYKMAIWDIPWQNFQLIRAKKIRDVGVYRKF